MKSILLAAGIVASALGAMAAPAITLEKVAEGMVSPTALQSLPTGQGMLVSDQVGKIYHLKPGSLEPQLWLDISSRVTNKAAFDERGLLGFALHPKFADNGRFFVVYSGHKRPEAPATWDHTMHLSEFKADGGVAKADSEKILLQIDEPYFNHNAGSLAFGKDGHLYMAVGDGGEGNDKDREGFTPPGHLPGGNAQSLNVLLGKILRIDVSKPGVVTIPSDNPVAEGKGRREIYAWGLRNPWRITFDRDTGRLFAADIGQEYYEEVDIIKKGGNYGWPIREGFHCFNQDDGRDTPEFCPNTAKDGSPLIDPIFEYKSYRSFRNDPTAIGISITGGYVYRGKAIPSLQGKYIFADWSHNMAVGDAGLYAATNLKGATWSIDQLKPASHPDKIRMFLPAFGEDTDGELYVFSNDTSQLINKTGKVWKIVPAPAAK
jgi:glucose/arabinose dehydrogenase